MQRFTTPAAITVDLDVPAGRILFTATERADTTVEVRPADASKNRDVKLADNTTVEYAEGAVRIRSVAKKASQILGPSGAVEVTVQLPAGSTVEATTASAEFRTVGPLSEVVYTSAHGPIALGEVAAARITSSASDITIGRLTGPAEVRTSSGDITIDEAVRGSVVLRTDAGSVSVGAAAGVSASLDAGSAHGRIRNSLTNTDGANAALNVHATTAHGDITAHSL